MCLDFSVDRAALSLSRRSLFGEQLAAEVAEVAAWLSRGPQLHRYLHRCEGDLASEPSQQHPRVGRIAWVILECADRVILDSTILARARRGR